MSKFMNMYIFPEKVSVSRAVYMDGGFPLSWESDNNATCGYVVEWYDACCRKNCPVDWIKVASPNNFSSIESGMSTCV